jgi:hypothetical protein
MNIKFRELVRIRGTIEQVEAQVMLKTHKLK